MTTTARTISDDPLVLDVCCGAKMWHFDKNNPNVLFLDIREESGILCDGREFDVKPDRRADFRKLPYHEECFNIVLFDPPHLRKAGANSWLAQKYGVLGENWKEDLQKGFSECFRVLKPYGTLIFKWNEDQIKLSEILRLTPEKPLIMHKRAKTHFIVFMKGNK